jgi:hypothetical protein
MSWFKAKVEHDELQAIRTRYEAATAQWQAVDANQRRAVIAKACANVAPEPKWLRERIEAYETSDEPGLFLAAFIEVSE